MKRFVDGIDGGADLPEARAEVDSRTGCRPRPSTFPCGRTADELVANDEAHLVWAVNLGVVDFNP